jgi:hypothetical protein
MSPQTKNLLKTEYNRDANFTKATVAGKSA